MRRTYKLSRKELIIKSIIILFVGVVLAVSCLFSSQIESMLHIGKTQASGDYVKLDELNTSELAADNFIVHYVDVGQGDCTFIELPDGKNMLIDTGDVATADNVVDYLHAVLGTSLVIDYMVITHSDQDHIGGATAVLAAFEVQNIYRPFAISGTYADDSTALANFTPNAAEDLGDYFVTMASSTDNNLKNNASKLPRVTTNIYKNVVEAIYAEGANVCVNHDELTLSSTQVGIEFSIKWYAPLCVKSSETNSIVDIAAHTNHTTGYVTKGYGANTAEGKNAVSPIIKLEYKEKKYLFSGDIYDSAEKDVVENLTTEEKQELANITAYQAGHHGASNSNCVELLNIITPTYTVVSAGKNNKYKHPTEEFLNRIKALPHDRNDYLLRTDLQGTIVFVEDNTGTVKYAANVEISQKVFEVEWWQLALGIFVIVAVFVICFRINNIKQSVKSAKKVYRNYR